MAHGVCAKVPFERRLTAERMARRHRQRRLRQDARPCERCQGGMAMEAYSCEYGPHWHIGHRLRRTRAVVADDAWDRAA